MATRRGSARRIRRADRSRRRRHVAADGGPAGVQARSEGRVGERHPAGEHVTMRRGCSFMFPFRWTGCCPCLLRVSRNRRFRRSRTLAVGQVSQTGRRTGTGCSSASVGGVGALACAPALQSRAPRQCVDARDCALQIGPGRGAGDGKEICVAGHRYRWWVLRHRPDHIGSLSGTVLAPRPYRPWRPES